jgi:hypothetical protein
VARGIRPGPQLRRLARLFAICAAAHSRTAATPRGCPKTMDVRFMLLRCNACRVVGCQIIWRSIPRLNGRMVTAPVPRCSRLTLRIQDPSSAQVGRACAADRASNVAIHSRRRRRRYDRDGTGPPPTTERKPPSPPSHPSPARSMTSTPESPNSSPTPDNWKNSDTPSGHHPATALGHQETSRGSPTDPVSAAIGRPRRNHPMAPTRPF